MLFTFVASNAQRLATPTPAHKGTIEQQLAHAAINENQRKVDALLKLAFSFRGTPYVYGASRPGAFDCSGIADTTGSFVGMIDGDVEGLGLGVAAGAHWQPTAASSRAAETSTSKVFLNIKVLLLIQLPRCSTALIQRIVCAVRFDFISRLIKFGWVQRSILLLRPFSPARAANTACFPRRPQRAAGVSA